MWAARLSAVAGRPRDASGYTTTVFVKQIDGTYTRLSDSAAARIKYYHATVQPRLKKVLPADTHLGPVTFQSDTDRSYAYVTTSLKDAWNYAEKAWSAGSGWGSGPPRVYQVEATGPVEVDPQYDAQGRHRGNFEHDARSKHPFKVLRELKMPRSMGKPEDWR